jgi:hypothetical protein
MVQILWHGRKAYALRITLGARAPSESVISRRGQVVDARAGTLRGEAAFTKMIALNEGGDFRRNWNPTFKPTARSVRKAGLFSLEAYGASAEALRRESAANRSRAVPARSAAIAASKWCASSAWAAWAHGRSIVSARPALKTGLRRCTQKNAFRCGKEFRALQGIHHPNLVSLGELVIDGDEGLLFFTRWKSSTAASISQEHTSAAAGARLSETGDDLGETGSVAFGQLSRAGSTRCMSPAKVHRDVGVELPARHGGAR